MLYFVGKWLVTGTMKKLCQQQNMISSILTLLAKCAYRHSQDTPGLTTPMSLIVPFVVVAR